MELYPFSIQPIKGNNCGLIPGPWYDPVLTAHLPGWVWLQMTGAHNFFRLYALIICDHAPAQRNVEDFDLVSAVPHSNHHTVGTASWQNHDSSSPQSAMSVYVFQTPTYPPHCGDNVKVKTLHIYLAMDIPVLLRGWVEAVVTND